jgi:preprotein translocase subunit Sec61beta
MKQEVIVVCAALTGFLGYYESFADKIALSTNTIVGVLFFCTALILACMGLLSTEGS